MVNSSVFEMTNYPKEILQIIENHKKGIGIGIIFSGSYDYEEEFMFLLKKHLTEGGTIEGIYLDKDGNPTTSKPIDVSVSDNNIVSASAAATANVQSASRPSAPLMMRAPGAEEVSTNTGINNTDDGMVQIDMSQIVSDNDDTFVQTQPIVPSVPAQPQFVPQPVPVMTPVQAPIVQPVVQQPTQNVTVNTTEVNPVTVNPSVPGVKRSKKDIEDIAATVAPQFIQPDDLVDASRALLNNYDDLKIIDKALGDKFSAIYRNDKGLVYVDVYSKDNPYKPIPEFSMIADVTGNVFSKAGKFWPASTNNNGGRVDFTPAIKLTEEGVDAFLSGDPIDPKLYKYNQGAADLNKYFSTRSIFDYVDNDNDAAYIMKKVKKAYDGSEEFRNKLGKGRMIMTGYTDKDHFTLETVAGVPKYLMGPKANNKKALQSFKFDGDNVTVNAASK